MTPAPSAIVDAHLHLWDPGRFRMPWVDGSAVLDRPYDLAELRAHAERLPVEGAVYVQVEVDPAYALLEARWAAERARRPGHPRLLALVPWAPIEHGAHARTFLDALLDAELAPLVRGVRRNLQDEPDPSFCLRPGFLDGLRLLAERGLTFDICCRHAQLPGVVEMVRRVPEVQFVLDHLGKPAIRAGELEPWRSHLARLAALPNVACKLSGLVTEADPAAWSAADLEPYVSHALAVFGEDRVLFGGDWPVVLEASSYRGWVETLAALTAHLSPDARRKLWADNARRVYRLEPPPALPFQASP